MEEIKELEKREPIITQQGSKDTIDKVNELVREVNRIKKWANSLENKEL